MSDDFNRLNYEDVRDAQLAKLSRRNRTSEEEERQRRAESLRKQIETLAENDARASWEMGRILHHMKEENLWQGYADTWREYIEGLGLSHPADHMRRRNYVFYGLDLGLDPDTEPRLISAGESKLYLGTKADFVEWVSENLREAERKRKPYRSKIAKRYEKYLEMREAGEVEKADALFQEIQQLNSEMELQTQDFLDLCQPVDEGGLSRADVRRYLEEKVGITEQDERSVYSKIFRSLRKAREHWHELTEDEWLVAMHELREDGDLRAWMGLMLRTWQEAARIEAEPVEADTGLPE